MTEITTYTELIESLRDKVGRLGVRYQDFDVLATFPAGLSGKVFGPCQVKRLGIEKVFDALRAAGLRLRLEDDPEQTAKMQIRIAEKFNPRQANQARMNNASSPISKPLMTRVYGHFLREARKKRWTGTTAKERSDHARMMVMARIKKERKRKRALKARRAGAAHRAANAAKAEASI